MISYMYYCNDCREVFDNLDTKEVNAEDYYGVSGQFMSIHTMTISSCPHCGSDNYEEMEKCAMCEEYFRHDDLIDTEGMPNGGVGYVCPSCYEDILD